MKKITSFIVGLFLLFLVIPANAQISFGLRGGMNVSKLNIKDHNANSATGWFLGPTAEFTVPIIGLGFDASLLYSRINTEIDKHTNGLNYLSIPMNLKYKLLIPLIQPFIYAGPEFNVSLGDNFKGNIDGNGSEWSMNVGAGVDLFSRLQV